MNTIHLRSIISTLIVAHTAHRRIGLIISTLITTCNLLAQPAAMDASFDPGSGVDWVLDVALQPDGKVIIVGGHHSFNGLERNGIARLNADGTLDTTFDPGTGLTGGAANCIALQSSGHVFIGGELTMYNGVERHKLAKLNADGSLDLSFTPRVLGNVGGGTGNVIGKVYSIAAQPDGKIVVGGQFTTYDGIPCRNIVRLNGDGSFDDTFDAGTGASDAVYTVIREPNGKILLGGSFYSINGTSRNHIARINLDGSLDMIFDPGTGFYADASVQSISLQPDGKIIAGGDFTSYNGIVRRLVARINSDGVLDTSFDAELSGNVGSNSMVRATAIQPDGKVIVGGSFNPLSKKIARLNADGSYDASFDPGLGFNFRVFATRLQPDGRIIVGGQFTTYDDIERKGIIRLLGGDANSIDMYGDDNSQVRLWPNPNKGDDLWLSMPYRPYINGVSIEICNLQGKHLAGQDSFPLNGVDIIHVDLRGLVPGTYIVSVVSKSDRFTKRLVIGR